MKYNKILAITLLFTSIFTYTTFAVEKITDTNTNNNDTYRSIVENTNISETTPTTINYNIYYGEILSIKDNIITFKNSDSNTILSFDIPITGFPSLNSKEKAFSGLKFNDKVCIYTKTINNKIFVQAVISNLYEDARDPILLEVKDIQKEEEYITIKDTNNLISLDLNKDTIIYPYRTKEILTIDDISVGSILVVWNSANENTPQTLQLPQKLTATDCMIINKGYSLNGWIKKDNNWNYYIVDSLCTGWHKINNDWYYFNNEGILQTGWILSNGKWYYSDSDGKMLANTYVENYYLGSNGALI